MKMLKKFNLLKNTVSNIKNKKNEFLISNKKYLSDNFYSISSKVDRNSQEFQVPNHFYLIFIRIIIRIL
jgi:hypothetical protein